MNNEFNENTNGVVGNNQTNEVNSNLDPNIVSNSIDNNVNQNISQNLDNNIEIPSINNIQSNVETSNVLENNIGVSDTIQNNIEQNINQQNVGQFNDQSNVVENPVEQNNVSTINTEVSNANIQGNVGFNNLENVNAQNNAFNPNPNNYTTNGIDFGFPQNDTVQSDPNIKGNNGFLKVVIIILVVAILGVAGFFGYKYFGSSISPKTKVLTSTKDFLEKNSFIANTTELYSFINNGYTLNLDASVKVKDKTNDLFNFGVAGSIVNNVKSKQLYYDLNLKSEDKNLISINGIEKDEKLYFKLKDVFNKYYYTEFIYEEIYNSGSDRLVKDITNGIVESISEEKFVSSNETKTINGKSMNLEKISLSLKESEIIDILINVMSKLKSDEEGLKFIVTEDLSLDEIKKSLDDAIKMLDESKKNITDDKVVLTYNTYLNNNNCMLLEILADEFSFVIEGYDTGTFNFKADDEDIFKGTFSKDEISITLVESNVNFKIKYSINSSSNNIKEVYNITVTYEEGTILVDLTLDMNDKTDIPSIDLSGAKDIEDITDEEQEEIIEKLKDLPLIGDYLSMYSNNYDLDYSIDSDDYDFDFDTNLEDSSTDYDFDTNFDLD